MVRLRSVRLVLARGRQDRLARDIVGRRAEVEKQRGIAEERLRRRCAEEGADYGVCGAADLDGAAPTPGRAARYNRGWSRIRGRVGALRAAEAALEAVDAALEAAEPAARLAALEAREAGLAAELEVVRDEMAVLARGGPGAGDGVDAGAGGRPAVPRDPGAVLRVPMPLEAATGRRGAPAGRRGDGRSRTRRRGRKRPPEAAGPRRPTAFAPRSSMSWTSTGSRTRAVRRWMDGRESPRGGGSRLAAAWKSEDSAAISWRRSLSLAI